MEDVLLASTCRDERGAPAAFRGSLAYDVLARLPLTLWFAFCGWTMANSLVSDLGAAPAVGATLVLDAAARIAAIAFVLFVVGALSLRRPAVARARGILPRLAALGGTFSVTALVFFQPMPHPPAVTVMSLLLICVGNALACYAIIHLGRSLSMMAEARRLVTSGPYSVIRHPLYAAEAIASAGLLLQYLSLPAICLWLAHMALQGCRMLYEEQLLRQTFREYGEYAQRVARLVPGVC